LFHEPKTASSNITKHLAAVTRARREAMDGHRGAIIFFMELSGEGKSTLADAVDETLHQRDFQTYVLDGDNVRDGLCREVGFTIKNCSENICLVG
jgi:adenylylsulfate kinase